MEASRIVPPRYIRHEFVIVEVLPASSLLLSPKNTLYGALKPAHLSVPAALFLFQKLKEPSAVDAENTAGLFFQLLSGIR